MVDVDEATVVTTILDLVELGAPVSRSGLCKLLDINPRAKRQVGELNKILKDLLGRGLLEGEMSKQLSPSKGSIAQLQKLASATEEWIAEAECLIDAYAHLIPEIDLTMELNEHPDWFREARFPWLKDDRFYLRGINRSGDRRISQPMNGWISGQPPDNWGSS